MKVVIVMKFILYMREKNVLRMQYIFSKTAQHRHEI